MKEITYKNFSLKTHTGLHTVRIPTLCQFELTFGCGLHCSHCYTDCFNHPRLLKKELATEQVYFILDKVHAAGCVWLCLTGGDPLARADFIDIYSYAKRKGFIITLFTTGYSMTRELAEFLKAEPPFAIEITINGTTKELYEKIHKTKGSFEKTFAGIRMILEEKLPLKLKVMVTKENLHAIDGIRADIEKLGVRYFMDYELHARLNGNLWPTKLRLSPEEVLQFRGQPEAAGCGSGECGSGSCSGSDKPAYNNYLFRCLAPMQDGLHVDPYGNLTLCNTIRKPAFNLLEVDIEEATQELAAFAFKTFPPEAKCYNCDLRPYCLKCPGTAWLEKGDMASHVDYYCDLAQATKDATLHDIPLKKAV